MKPAMTYINSYGNMKTCKYVRTENNSKQQLDLFGNLLSQKQFYHIFSQLFSAGEKRVLFS
jgi:hypothetical protein